MHEEFQKRLSELALSLADVEAKIGCPKNYLSRFINGDKVLPTKWEAEIRKMLQEAQPASLEAQIASLKAENETLRVAPNDILRPWINEVETYCKSIGMYPDQLIEDHKKAVEMAKNAKSDRLSQLLAQELGKQIKK